MFVGGTPPFFMFLISGVAESALRSTSTARKAQAAAQTSIYMPSTTTKKQPKEPIDLIDTATKKPYRIKRKAKIGVTWDAVERPALTISLLEDVMRDWSTTIAGLIEFDRRPEWRRPIWTSRRE